MTIIVTGAAGFVGANNVKALNDARRARHHRRRQPDALGEVPQPRRLRDRRLPRQGGVPRPRATPCAAEAGRRVPPGRLLGHDGDRRPLHAGQQLPLLAGVAPLVPGTAGAVHLRVVRLGLRPRAGVRGGPRQRAAAQRLRLLEVPVRPGGAARAGRPASAGHRPALLQRLRPARDAQGAHGVGGVPPLQPVPSPKARSSSSKAATATRTASSGATSSTSTMSSRSTCTSGTDPVSGIYNVGTGRAQAFNDVALTVVNTLREHGGHAPLSLEQLVGGRPDRVRRLSRTRCAASTRPTRRPICSRCAQAG